MEARLSPGPDPRTTSAWHSSWTLSTRKCTLHNWGFLDPNKLSVALRGEFLCTRGLQRPQVQLPQEGNESGRVPAMRASFGPGTHTGLQGGRRHRGQTCSLSSGQNEDIRTLFSLLVSQALCLQQPLSRQRRSSPGAACPPHDTARPVCSQHLREHLTEKETEAGAGAGTKKQLVSQAQELKRDQKHSWLGSYRNCLLCRITTWSVLRAATW